jgi:membrane associated rhomboid family serine protease
MVGGTRQCPKCLAEMGALRLEGVQVDLCPRCLGMWFDGGELPRAARLKFSDAADGAALARSSRTARRCPACTKPLYERQVEPRASILVDQCPQCGGLFLDRGEFTRVKDYYRTAGARADHREIREPPPGTDLADEVDPDSPGAVLFQWLTGLPLELDQPQTLLPPVVIGVVAVNLAVLITSYVCGLPQAVEALGAVPADVVAGRRLYSLLTSMFVHAGFFHFLGNMYFLYVAGDNVEERLGHWRFLGFYLACGIVAGLAQVLSNVSSVLPCVGASGAVSGVLGAYVVLFPRTRFRVRWFYFLWYHAYLDIPVWAYLGFWVALQVAFAAVGAGGVAWWAHLGGFACGLAVGASVRWGAAKARPAAA